MKVFSLSKCSEPRAWKELNDQEKFYIAQSLGGSRGYNRVLSFMSSLSEPPVSDQMGAELQLTRSRFEDFKQRVKEIFA
jgi:hypothetical protein